MLQAGKSMSEKRKPARMAEMEREDSQAQKGRQRHNLGVYHKACLDFIFEAMKTIERS